MTSTLRTRLLRQIAMADASRRRTDQEVDALRTETARRDREQWWTHLLTHFFQRNDSVLFADLRIDRRVFDVLLDAVCDLPLQTRGRRSFVHSHREQLLFLHVYLAFGTSVAALLVSPRIRTVCEVHRLARRIAFLYHRRLKELFIINRREERVDERGVGHVIDCTVVQIKHPHVSFNEAKIWFSGKHYIYCVKKEVIVNAATGTAALVSAGRPGSVHDLTIMRGNADAINRLVGESVILGDKGYRGGRPSVPNLYVVEDADNDAVRTKRVVVECFFGRLKKKYSVFGAKWTLAVDLFDAFFDCACAMTNVDILFNPLSGEDKAYNDEVIARWQAREAMRRQRRDAINDEYRSRTTVERLGRSEAISRDVGTMASFLFSDEDQ